ncbi:uracil-DNA glycosylase [Candidatus Profftia tarda]|uniref:Uracil-DNA glycosylase n=1 Tax=Candidatus Profftia tarda TaxID=1177216 RepID=A0A8E4EXV1_9ENTR|nr:uracil-DNA glycosylase [Candidatus Profftia tarda]CAD6507178.1 Uracil-DNA glycosylase [Candidatus Profftia tarda]
MYSSLNWHDVIGVEKEKPYFYKILSFLSSERRAGKIIYPPQKDIFNAFRFTAFKDVKVVILGQDPYHGPDQAHGLSFSVLPGISIPPSLMNIYKELQADIKGFNIPNHGCLKSWSDQGILLLNTILTVEAGQPHSHAKIGWDNFTDSVVSALNEYRKGIVFLLWGAYAHKKGNRICAHKHWVLKASHPSPMSAHSSFLGCRHFSITNQLLVEQGISMIDWQPS